MVDVVEYTLAPVIDVVGHPVARVVDIVIFVIEYTPEISFLTKKTHFTAGAYSGVA